jgi:hypothetical protein
MGKIVRAGAGAGIFDKLKPEPELEPDKNGPAPQHCLKGLSILKNQKSLHIRTHQCATIKREHL